MKFASFEVGPDIPAKAVEVILTCGRNISALRRAYRRHPATGTDRIARTARMHLPASVRVYSASTARNMRRSFDGL